MVVDTALKRIPLHDVHVALGAKIVPFAGFEMPVQYPTGITAEHKAVREKAGLFDVSHMGEFMVRGRQAVEFVNYVTTNDVTALAPGQAQYSTILREDGTIVDDCLVYRAEDRVLMVVNGSNIDKDFAHISQYIGDFDATLEDLSDTIALLALQGPDAATDGAVAALGPVLGTPIHRWRADLPLPVPTRRQETLLVLAVPLLDTSFVVANFFHAQRQRMIEVHPRYAELLVSGRDLVLIRDDPHLNQVQRPAGVQVHGRLVVLLRVPDTGSGGHTLGQVGIDDAGVAL